LSKIHSYRLLFRRICPMGYWYVLPLKTWYKM